MPALRFDNRFTRELPRDPVDQNVPRQVRGAFWTRTPPTPVAAPRLLAHSREMAERLGFGEADVHSAEFLAAFSGNGLLPGMEPYATVYGGHQFGNWAGQLGDGRAIGLGEIVNAAGERWELQLKGAGPTPYSRTADGRAVLRSSIREFLCSEAMHHLGVPTTRALSLVATGEQVIRDMFYDGRPQAEPGAIVCRVAPSFTRFGHFEIFAARGERAELERLVRFTIARDFPELATVDDERERFAAWFGTVAARTARLVVEWMRVGFVHGVMNTDNMSILGLTIDYGPYGWIDDFDPGWTPNTTDAAGRRYCFGRQPAIARWNLERLADALASVSPSAQILEDGLQVFEATWAEAASRMLASKFGLGEWREDDQALVSDAFQLMQQAELDMTDFFRRLAPLATADVEALRGVAYREDRFAQQREALQAWLDRWLARVQASGRPADARRTAMDAVNPRYVLRNYLAQQAIEAATAGDLAELHRLQDVLRRPYAPQAGAERFAALRPEWARSRPGCSMLSCSS